MRFINILLKLILFSGLNGNSQAVAPPFIAGEEAPEFSGLDQEGNTWCLSEMVKKGPVVLVFFRGEWCPYCNRHLSQLQDSLYLLKAKGATVITVTPQLSENIDKTIRKTEASFPIIYDEGYQIMKTYHLDFRVSDNTIRRYRLSGINLKQANGNTDYILPVPATFVINQEQVITYLHYDPNYKSRSDISTILKELDRL